MSSFLEPQAAGKHSKVQQSREVHNKTAAHVSTLQLGPTVTTFPASQGLVCHCMGFGVMLNCVLLNPAVKTTSYCTDMEHFLISLLSPRHCMLVVSVLPEGTLLNWTHATQNYGDGEIRS